MDGRNLTNKSAAYIGREKRFPDCTQSGCRTMLGEGGAHESPFSLPSVAGKDSSGPTLQLLGRPLSLHGYDKDVAA